MNAGCEAYEMAPLHVVHDQPITTEFVNIANVDETSHSPDDRAV
jgi:hypothetical protein